MGGDGWIYEAIGVVLDGLTSSKTFMPPMVVDVLEDTRPDCIQCKSSLVGPPAT